MDFDFIKYLYFLEIVSSTKENQKAGYSRDNRKWVTEQVFIRDTPPGNNSIKILSIQMN